ncbi:hypothetical protein CAEBREN_00135 [Caenorhabditis brenneri]|uniref:Uncharacterized protein n=1 Tax=Caenorhabditis brenneri TaxID=135651 RepID=G0NF31_CAEBE|nr:hypothetical protein CAEBREN_00135 [Caenorhabditis brenneri]
MTKTPQPVAVSNYKKKVTLAVSRAEHLLTQANTLLLMDDEEIQHDNLNHTVDKLLAHKKEMEEIEVEISDVTIDDSEATPAEKAALQDSMESHLAAKFPQLFGKIDAVINELLQRVEIPEPVSPTCREGKRGKGSHDSLGDILNEGSPRSTRSTNPSPSRQRQHERPPQQQQGDNRSRASHQKGDMDERMKRMEANMDWFKQAFDELRADNRRTRQQVDQRFNGLAAPPGTARDDVCHISSVPSSVGATRSVEQNMFTRNVNTMGGNQLQWIPNRPQPAGFQQNNTGTHAGFNPTSRFVYSNPVTELQSYGIAREDVDTTIRMEQMRATLVQSALTALGKFTGEEYDYPSFIAQFDNMVHNNPLIDVKVKQTMLLSLLPPKLIREHQTSDVSEASYFLIRSNLEKQFNRQDTQFNTIADQITAFTFPEDITELRSRLTLFSTMAHKLQAYGFNPNDRYFLRTVVNRFPPRVRRAAGRRLRREDATLNDIIDEVHNVLSEQQGYGAGTPASALGYDDNYVNQIDVNVATQQRQRQGYATKPPAGRPRFIPPAKTIPCRYCDMKSHCAAECKMNVDKKRLAVNKKKLCFNCLSEKHSVMECKSRFSCFHCQRRHFSGHCGAMQDIDEVTVNILDIDILEDDIELERQLFRGPGAETPDF